MIPLLSRIALASIAYEPNATIAAKKVEALGLKLKAIVEVDDAQALIVSSSSSTIIAHRGTPFTEHTNVDMIWDNLNRDHTDLSNNGMIVRGGFWHPLCDLWPSIVRQIDPIFQVECVGHSLGGIRALLMAALVPPWMSYVVTAFGPPTGANSEFYKMAYDGRVPPIVFGRKHDFALNWSLLDPDTVQPGPIQHLLSPGIETLARWNPWWSSVGDHSVDLYQSDILLSGTTYA